MATKTTTKKTTEDDHGAAASKAYASGLVSNKDLAARGDKAAQQAVYDSGATREDQSAVKNSASELLGLMGSTVTGMDDVLKAYLGASSFGDTKSGGDAEKKLSQMFSGLDTITPDQQAGIDAKGAETGLGFDDLIAEAEGQKKQGMPKAIMAAGERGGFMNTQHAGAAALQSTEGGTFVGNGGELNRIQSEYDRNISQLNAQKKVAVASAVAAAKEAVLTGNRQKLNEALQYYQMIKGNYNDSVSMMKEKLTVANTFNQQSQGDAQQKLTTLVNTFGASYAQDNPTELASLATSAGYDGPSFVTALSKLTQKGELREVGGSLYNITTDADGNPVAKLVISKSSGGGSGGGSGSGGGTASTGQFTQKELMADDIQNYADMVERGEIAINGVPTGTKSQQTRAKVIQVMKQRQESIDTTGTKNAPASQTKALALIRQEMEQNRGGDSKVNPSTYASIRKRLAKNTPELLPWFDKNYPAASTLNPNDPNAAKILGKAPAKSSGSNPYATNQ